MEQGRVERLDHCGVMASVSKDLGLIAMLDTRLVPDDQEVITPGEAVAAMRLNGLGCAQRPLALTPQCFANNPRDLWLREGIAATMVNRFKLGRTLAQPRPTAATCCWRNWPVPSVPPKAWRGVSILSTRPVLPARARTARTATSTPCPFPTATPRPTGQPCNRRGGHCWCLTTGPPLGEPEWGRPHLRHPESPAAG